MVPLLRMSSKRSYFEIVKFLYCVVIVANIAKTRKAVNGNSNREGKGHLKQDLEIWARPSIIMTQPDRRYDSRRDQLSARLRLYAVAERGPRINNNVTHASPG